MTGSTQTPGNVMVSGPNMPTQQVTSMNRMVTFIIYCAPRDDNNLNPMYTAEYGHDATHTAVTDSASYLTRMPYVVVDADTKKVIWPLASSHQECDVILSVSSTSALHDGQRKVHTLLPIHVPDTVNRIALHIANDASRHRRNFQLFPWTVSDAAHSKVHIYEVRSDLKRRFIDRNNLQTPPDNALIAKPNVAGEYYGCLDGDLWLRVSHEFTDVDITRLCPPETISRNLLAGTSQANPHAGAHPQTSPVQQSTSGGVAPHADGPHAYAGPITGSPATSAPMPGPIVQPSVVGNAEQLQVDWQTTLAPIYTAGADSRSMESFTVEIDNLGITLIFTARALANAINTSNSTTIQQALRRTSPRTFAAILKAAWRLHIDKLSLSSSWRPMLGSRLHKMGIGLDVVRFDDDAENIHMVVNNNHAYGNHQGKTHDDNPFPTTSGGQELSRLYAELNGDASTIPNAVYTPWMNWVEPHDTHMHITVKDE